MQGGRLNYSHLNRPPSRGMRESGSRRMRMAEKVISETTVTVVGLDGLSADEPGNRPPNAIIDEFPSSSNNALSP